MNVNKYIKEIKETIHKMGGSNIKFDGFFIAVSFIKDGKKGVTGTFTRTENRGITLRLIEEAKIQRMHLDNELKAYAEADNMSQSDEIEKNPLTG